MNFDEAKFILERAERHELRDHAFGDMEVFWRKDEKIVATGYFGVSSRRINMMNGGIFSGDEAMILKECGNLAGVDRNDTTGPEDFEIGRVMPEIKEELTLHNIFSRGKDDD